MQFTGTLQFQGVVGEPGGEPVPLARFESEMARVQGLSDQAIEALCTIIDARDA